MKAFLLCIVFLPPPVVAQFSDVYVWQPFYNTANRMGQLGITSGCQPNLFCPLDLALRSQLAVFVVRSLFQSNDNLYCFSPDPAWSQCGAPYGRTVCPFGSTCLCANSIPYFDDVQSGHGQFRWIQKARNLGASCGTSASPPMYSPDGAVSAFAAAIQTSRANQLKPCVPSTGICSGTVNDSSTDYPRDAYFQSDLPYGAYGFNFAQKARDTGAIAIGCAERSFCGFSSLTRGDLSYYITRGIVGEFKATRGVTQSPANKWTWEPSVVRGSTRWAMAWTEITQVFQPPEPGKPLDYAKSYTASWDPNSKTWLPPTQFQPPGSYNPVDFYVVWNPSQQRFEAVALDFITLSVHRGFSTDGVVWSYNPTPVMLGAVGSFWDYPSIAVDGYGRIAIAAVRTDFANNPPIGLYVTVSTDGGQTFSTPTLLANTDSVTGRGRHGRIVATSGLFHAFVPEFSQYDSPTPIKVHRYWSIDGGFNWTYVNTLLDFQAPKMSSWTANGEDHACIPETQGDCREVFYGTTVDAAGDPLSTRWSVVFPVNYNGKNNLFMCTSDRGCFFVNQAPYDQFLGSTSVAPDGSYWVNYQTFTRSGASSRYATNVFAQSIRYPPGQSGLGATVATGITPARWSLTSGSTRCVVSNCYGAGDYSKIAADYNNVVAVPQIQQGIGSQNTLHGIFDNERYGTFYAPYSIEPEGVARELKPGDPSLRTALLQFLEPLPTGPPVDHPSRRFAPNHVPITLGSSVRGLGKALPAEALPPARGHRWLAARLAAGITAGLRPGTAP